MINDMLSQAVKGIADIITKRVIMLILRILKQYERYGLAVMVPAMRQALIARQKRETGYNSPLLENRTINGAHGVLLNITGGPSMKLHEINEAASIVYEQQLKMRVILSVRLLIKHCPMILSFRLSPQF